MALQYMTQEGLDKLKKELAEAIAQRPVISAAIAEARDKGDLSENAEYEAAREAQGLLELNISKLQNLGYEIIPTFIQKNTRIAVSQIIKYVNNVIASDKIKAMLITPELNTTHSKKFSFCETFIGVSEATKAL